MKNMNIQEKLRAWAEETYRFYSEKARNLDIDFYTQSDLTLLTDDKPVELMVVGINPGCGGHYQKDRFAKPEDLLRGNCDFKKEGNPHFPICEWLIVRRLVSILDYGHTGHMNDLLKDESRFVFTNATFFSTHKEAGLKGTEVEEAQKASIEYTKGLIDLIRPKHIICLGGKNCMNLLLNRTAPLLADVVKLDYGMINGIPVYGIDHTSSAWPIEKKELVGKALGRAFEVDDRRIDCREFYDQSKDIIEIFTKKRNDRDEIKHEMTLRWTYIYVCLCNHCKFSLGLEVYEKTENRVRFSVDDQQGHPALLVTISNQSKKEIGVRYQKNDQPKDERFDVISSALMDIDKSFKPMINRQGNVTWIGCLDIANRLKDTDTFIHETKGILDKVVESMREIL